MKDFVQAVQNNNLVEAKEVLSEALNIILAKKLVEVKKMVAAKFIMEERKRTWSSPRKMGRVKLIPIRIRTLPGTNRPVVQRRKKFASQKGFTIRSGHIVRMKATERMHRKRGARRAKIKRRAKRMRIKMKFERSLRKRQSMGLPR
jgi:hypothetical protein